MGVTKKTVIVIAGPTAVGKTALSIDCARVCHTEIISADSRQLFRELTIGTAKPTAAELALVPHHFIDHRSIHENYNADDFGKEGRDLLKKLFTRYSSVIVCGGSGLYLKALLEGFADIPDIPASVRASLIEGYKLNGIEWLQEQLMDLSPVESVQIDMQNPNRLMRALEVRITTGMPIQAFQKKKPDTLPYRVLKIGLEMDRTALYERIEARIDKMMLAGLEEEAKKLYPYKEMNALQTVGYQELFDYFDGIITRQEAIDRIKQNTRNYAKRQLTWFKGDKDFHWYGPEQRDEVHHLIGTYAD